MSKSAESRTNEDSSPAPKPGRGRFLDHHFAPPKPHKRPSRSKHVTGEPAPVTKARFRDALVPKGAIFGLDDESTIIEMYERRARV